MSVKNTFQISMVTTNQDVWGLNTNFNIQKYNPSEFLFWVAYCEIYYV